MPNESRVSRITAWSAANLSRREGGIEHPAKKPYTLIDNNSHLHSNVFEFDRYVILGGNLERNKRLWRCDVSLDERRERIR
jgi:hypothetical protein